MSAHLSTKMCVTGNQKKNGTKYKNITTCYLWILLFISTKTFKTTVLHMQRYWALHIAMNLVESLWVRYKVQGKLSGHHGGDNVVQKLKEFHFWRIIYTTANIWEQTEWRAFCSNRNKRGGRVYHCQGCGVTVHIDGVFRGQAYKEECRMQFQAPLYYLHSVGSYHHKFHFCGTKIWKL